MKPIERLTMVTTPEIWQLRGFSEYFKEVHEIKHDHKFAWVLGAGASCSSGIPTGKDLVIQWAKKLFVRLAQENVDFESWTKSKAFGVKGFSLEKGGEFYTQVYQRCFADHPDEGYAVLEDLMEARDPSPGYSILAKILEEGRHRVVVTTNFDNLVADSLAIFTETFPFVCGHESLTEFVKVSMRRPLICKIHRDLLLGPQNDPMSLKRLHENWARLIRELLSEYTPIVIGYGGNDDTLMDLLASLSPDEIKGRLIWCYYESDFPKKRILDLVSHLNGVIVPVPDFDLLMVLLGAAIGIEPLDEVIDQRANKRSASYREKLFELNTSRYPDIEEALSTTFERGGWQIWSKMIDREQNEGKKRELFKRAISTLKTSSKAYFEYARFLHFTMQDEGARANFERALLLEPLNSDIVGGWAFYLDQKGHLDEAENAYEKALKLNDECEENIANFAFFLTYTKNDFERGRDLYLQAAKIAKQKSNGEILLEFARFLSDTSLPAFDLEKADSVYQEAKMASPKSEQIHLAYARFLAFTCNDYSRAAVQFEDAIRLIGGQSERIELMIEKCLVSVLNKDFGNAIEPLDEIEEAIQMQNNTVQLPYFFLCSGIIRCAIGKSDEEDIIKFENCLTASELPSPDQQTKAFESVLNSLVHEDQERYQALQKMYRGDQMHEARPPISNSKRQFPV